MTTELQLKVNPIIEKNNLAIVDNEITEFVKNMRTELTDDEHFIEAKEDIKDLKAMETALANEKENIFNTGDLRAINDSIIRISDLCRENRLKLEKLVKSEEQRRKDKLVNDAYEKVTDAKSTAKHAKHIEIPDIREFRDQIKNKRTDKSMREALDRFVGVQLTDISTQSKAIGEKLARINELIDGHESLFDIDYLMSFGPGYEQYIKLQIDSYNRKIEAEAEKKAAEQQRQAQPPAPAPEPTPEPTPPAPKQSPSAETHDYIIRIHLNATKGQAKNTAKQLAATYGRQNVKLTTKEV
ncbi:MAG: hypothetical protein DWP95_02125 [Proteobacteria bacterium]|nr:MAG: hypothetical protein DWP95_02125 [Pseudomonadota bacterium]